MKGAKPTSCHSSLHTLFQSSLGRHNSDSTIDAVPCTVLRRAKGSSSCNSILDRLGVDRRFDLRTADSRLRPDRGIDCIQTGPVDRIGAEYFRTDRYTLSLRAFQEEQIDTWCASEVRSQKAGRARRRKGWFLSNELKKSYFMPLVGNNRLCDHTIRPFRNR